MDAFDLLDIESDAVGIQAMQEPENILGHLDGFLGQYGYRMKRDMIFLELTDTLQDTKQRALTAAVLAIKIIDESRTVDADPDLEMQFLEEIAPFLIDERAVGLQAMLEADLGRQFLSNDVVCVPIEFGACGQGFARMPDHGELLLDNPRLPYVPDSVFDHSHRQALAYGLVRKIAVGTVQIAVRRGL